MAREYNVSKLLLGTKVVKEGLADILHHQLIHKTGFDVTLVLLALIICEDS